MKGHDKVSLQPLVEESGNTKSSDDNIKKMQMLSKLRNTMSNMSTTRTNWKVSFTLELLEQMNSFFSLPWLQQNIST